MTVLLDLRLAGLCLRAHGMRLRRRACVREGESASELCRRRYVHEVTDSTVQMLMLLGHEANGMRLGSPGTLHAGDHRLSPFELLRYHRDRQKVTLRLHIS